MLQMATISLPVAAIIDAMIHSSADDNAKEAAKKRYANRFVRAPAGWAYVATDGLMYPLSEAEASQSKQEGLALLDQAFARQKLGHQLSLAGLFFGALFLQGLIKPFVPHPIGFLMFCFALAHGYIFHRFSQDSRKADLIVEDVAKKRQALSPAMEAQLKQTNPFRIPAYAMGLAAFLYMCWLGYRTTGYPDPEMAGAAIDLATNKWHWLIIFGLAGLSAILAVADRMWEKQRARNIAEPKHRRKRSKELF